MKVNDINSYHFHDKNKEHPEPERQILKGVLLEIQFKQVVHFRYYFNQISTHSPYENPDQADFPSQDN